jgi:hypothetical protein
MNDDTRRASMTETVDPVVSYLRACLHRENFHAPAADDAGDSLWLDMTPPEQEVARQLIASVTAYGDRRERAGREAEQSRCAAILETTAELVERALTMTDTLKATAELRVEAARYRALARRIRGGPESTPDA